MLDKLAEEILGKTLWQSSQKERVLRAESRVITRAEMGDKWPLTIDRAELCTNSLAIFLRADGKCYGVNGMAPGFLMGSGEEVRDLHEIWRDDPTLPGLKVSITPLFQIAKEMESVESHHRSRRTQLRTWQANAIKVLLLPLLLATNLLNGVLSLLLKTIKGPGGRIFAFALVLAGLAVAWLTTGILLKELYEAVVGFWREPFGEHGIYFALAVPVTLFVLVKIAVAASDKR